MATPSTSQSRAGSPGYVAKAASLWLDAEGVGHRPVNHDFVLGHVLSDFGSDSRSESRLTFPRTSSHSLSISPSRSFCLADATIADGPHGSDLTMTEAVVSARRPDIAVWLMLQMQGKIVDAWNELRNMQA